MKTQTKKQIKAYKKSILNEVIRCERDLYQLSQGNLKVLQTVPLMMQDDFWRGQLRKLVVEYLKKGISACAEKDKDIVENILNRIDTCVISPFEGVSLDKDITRGKTMDLMREQFNKTCNQIREEILNSQESLNGNKANTSPTAPKNVEELSEVGCDRKSLSAPDTQTLIKQALSQRNQEIRANIDKLFIEYRRLGRGLGDVWEDVIKQLTNSEGENV